MRRAVSALCAVFLIAVPAVADERLSDQWMEILMNGKKIGFSRQKVTRTTSGYAIEGRTLMKFEVQGVEQSLSTSQTYFLDAAYHPLRFTYMQKMLNHQQFFEGVVEGKKLRLTVRSGGNVTEKTIDFDGDMYIADAIGLLLGKKKLKEGQKYRYRVFLEPLLASEVMTVEVQKKMKIPHRGKQEEVYPVTMKLKSFSTVSYFTPDGRLLREISPMGFVSEEVDEVHAVSFPARTMSFTDLLAYSLIPLEKPLKNPDGITALELRVSGLSGPAIIPDDDRQKAVSSAKSPGKETWTVNLSVRTAFPAQSVARPVSDVRFKTELASSVEAQSDDPRIVTQSAKIVGNEKDAYRAAAKINRWVHENVTKKYVDTFSAVETLQTLEGECQSHTTLFAALARAAGIPARTVSGIVYSEQFGGFLYHAWPEVWVGAWVAMDPTFGQDIADATHVKLSAGELSSQLQLFEFIGKIGIEVTSAKGGE
ncbi:MAG: transglutaminase domain-containing protein [Nitrospinae bacterium]|nr:transglutaminase domain-containing protein [Nitrospinota bacterium]